MSFAVRKAEVACAVATGVQTISPPGGDPGLGAAKAVVMFGVCLTADGTGANARMFTGVATPDGNDGWCAFTSDDAAATGVGGGGSEANAALKVMTAATTPTVDAIATVSAWNANGSIGLNWSDAPSSAWRLHVLLFYGSDITNATCGMWGVAAGTGAKSLTGLGFTPDYVLKMTTAQSIGTETRANGAHFSWSMFTATDSVAGGLLTTEAATMANVCAQRSGRTMYAPSSAGATLFDATLTSMDAGGWTENYSVNAGAHNVIYLALKGPRVKVGMETKPTTISTKSTTAPGFRPDGALMFSWGQIANTAVDSTGAECAKLSVGAWDGNGNEGSVWIGDDDGLADSESNMRTSALKGLQFTSNFTGAVDAEADFTDTATGFDADWTVSDAVATEYAYAVFGPNATVKQVSGIAVTGSSTVGITVRRRRRISPPAVAAVSAATVVTVRRRRRPVVQVAAASSVTVNPRRRRRPVVLVQAASAVTVAPARRKRTGAVQVQAASSVAATPRRRKRTGAVQVAASSTVTVNPRRRRRPDVVAVAALSSVAAAPRRRRRVVAGVSALSSVAITAQVRSPLKQVAVGVAAIANVQVSTRRRRRVTGVAVTCSSAVTVNPRRRRRTAGAAVTASSAVTVNPRRRRRPSGVAVTCSSTVTASPRRRRRPAVGVGSSSAVTALPRRRRRVTAVVNAASAVEVWARQLPDVWEPYTYADGRVDLVSSGRWAPAMWAPATSTPVVTSQRLVENAGAGSWSDAVTTAAYAPGRLEARVLNANLGYAELGLYADRTPGWPDGYVLEHRPDGTVKLWTVTNGAYGSPLTTDVLSSPIGAGDRWIIERDGTALRAYVRRAGASAEQLILSATDATYTGPFYLGTGFAPGSGAVIDDVGLTYSPPKVYPAITAAAVVTVNPRRRRRVAPAVFAASSVTVANVRRRHRLELDVSGGATVSVVVNAGVSTLPTIAVGSYP